MVRIMHLTGKRRKSPPSGKKMTAADAARHPIIHEQKGEWTEHDSEQRGGAVSGRGDAMGDFSAGK